MSVAHRLPTRWPAQRWTGPVLARIAVVAAIGILAINVSLINAEDHRAVEPIRSAGPPRIQPNRLRVELAEPFALSSAPVTRYLQSDPAVAGIANEDPELLDTPATTRATGPRVIDGVDIGFEPIGSLNIVTSPKPEGEFESVPKNFAEEYFATQPEIHYGAPIEIEHFPVPYRYLASEFSYGPVYFENKNLERHGRSYGMFQPLASAGHFLIRVPALPYLAAAEPHWNDYYPSDPYVAGRPAPRVREWPEFDPLAASWEAGLAIGLILLVP